MLKTDPLAGRAISAYPLSVGTSLAFESIFPTTNPGIDVNRVIPQRIKLTDYDEIWVNLATLVRNMYGSLPKEDAAMVSGQALAEAVLGEMEMIQSLCLNESNNRIQPVFYACSYKKLEQKASKYVTLRTDDTVNQKIYRTLLQLALKTVYSKLNENKTLRSYDSELNRPGSPYHRKTRAIIVTHSAWDLTSYKNFDNLDLVESHTGVLKTRATWYTKYQNGKELGMLPFMEGLLQVFGDSEHFRPMDIRLRRELIDVAQEFRWSPVTTRDKVRLNLDNLKNPYFREVLKSVI